MVYAVQGAPARPARGCRCSMPRLVDETFERPAEFDLAAFWREWCAAQDVSRARYVVTVRVAPGFVPELPSYLRRPRARADRACRAARRRGLAHVAARLRVAGSRAGAHPGLRPGRRGAGAVCAAAQHPGLRRADRGAVCVLRPRCVPLKESGSRRHRHRLDDSASLAHCPSG